ncbi:MAG: glycosyltransferase family A protein [Candidatus Binatia bacterium]
MPAVSVIIPAHNGARHLPATLQSLVHQTFDDFEVLVVDDGSTDETAAVVRQAGDRRILLLSHAQNLGADRARNTGICAASAPVLAFLDQDDLFHPDKLRTHVEFLRAHPDVGFTYNAHFELHYSSDQIRGLWRPPTTLTLADLLLGFPIAPSDMVTTKRWASTIGMWPGIRGAEYVFLGRLWLAGCKFACVDRTLNYRRYHSGRGYRDIAAHCASELTAQRTVFADPRVPADVRPLRDVAFANTHLDWAYHAFAQNETPLGQRLLREAVRLNAATIGNQGRRLLELVIDHGTADESVDHEARLASIFEQLPAELAWLGNRRSWAIAQGCLWRGARAVIWGRAEDGRRHFARAGALAAEIDDPFVQRLTHELRSHEKEYGAVAGETVRGALLPFLRQVGGAAAVRALKGCYAINRAFSSYRHQRYREVPAPVLRAFANDPRYLLNRGAFSILLRSLTGTGRPDFRSESAPESRRNHMPPGEGKRRTGPAGGRQ